MSEKPTGFSRIYGMFAGTANRAKPAQPGKSVDPQAAFARWEANEFSQSFGDVSGEKFEADNKLFLSGLGGRVAVGESHSIPQALESINQARAAASAPAAGLRKPGRS